MQQVDVILGLQWGDEGKGKIVDYLSPRYDIIARFQGGPNAGHTLHIDGEKHVLHTIPSGIFHSEKINIIGNGVIIDPLILKNEITNLMSKGVKPVENMYISTRANIITPTHRCIDAASEAQLGNQKIGSTLKGIGPCYTDKVARFGLRMGDILMPDFKKRYQNLKNRHELMLNFYNFDLANHQIDKLSFDEYEKQWFEAIEFLKQFQIIDTELYINKAIKEGKAVLAEGAQGTMLDIDFGTYPFVTSSNTITAGVCSGLGISPKAIGRVFGIFKAYCTRVGSGPFPTQIDDNYSKMMQEIGREFGATTGRLRRCGWLDLPALKYAIMVNGVTDLIMMKADVMNDFDIINVCSKYNIDGQNHEEVPFKAWYSEIKPINETFEGWQQSLDNVVEKEQIPAKLSSYIKYIENALDLKMSMISIGPEREKTIEM